MDERGVAKMKIGQDMQPKVNQPPIQKVKEGKGEFGQMVQTQSHKLVREELGQLLDDITKQGEKLAKFRSFRDLAKFKRMIKEFLQETVYKGLKLNHQHNFNANHYTQKLTTVEEIDAKLIELTEDVLDQEKKTVDLLGVIGEVRGLLINIYT